MTAPARTCTAGPPGAVAFGGRLLAALLCVWLVIAAPRAGAADAEVDAVAGRFLAQVPDDWRVVPGAWQFFDLPACFEAGGPCFGNNPSSPYAFPVFPGGSQIRLAQSEAVVVFFRTPPPVRYFGFTQYLLRRSTSLRPVTASLSRSINHTGFAVIGGGIPVFDRLAVLVWTADLGTLASVKGMLRQQGIDDAEVNVLPIPVQLPLRMGYEAGADVFTMLLRAALPAAPAAFDAYVADPPFRMFKVGPVDPPPAQPAPTIGYPSSVSGVSEPPELARALDHLVADIRRAYAGRFRLQEQKVRLYLMTGLECIAGESRCTMDNYDALYSTETTAFFPAVDHLQDLVIVAGVNHRKTHKSMYMNITVQDPATQSGVASVDDRQFTVQSALFHAGVRRPDDPRVQAYADLYAYAIGYDCNGIAHCFEIPRPTQDNPVGLEPGARFGLLARAYVEPRTGVRPDPSETVRERVLLARVR